MINFEVHLGHLGERTDDTTQTSDVFLGFVHRCAAIVAADGPYGHLPKHPIFRSLFDDVGLEAITKHARAIRSGFDEVVVIGTGGSSLGAQAFLKFNAPLDSNERTPKLRFPDNLGAHHMTQLTQMIDPKRTHYIIISKSGRTAETIAQFSVFLKCARETLDDNWTDHFTIITQNCDNPLKAFADTHDIRFFEHPADLCGRFSAFSVVGMLPVMIGGLDGKAIIQSARDYLTTCLNAEAKPEHCPALMAAASSAYLLEHREVSQSVLMPYDSRLVHFGRWYQQLWAESLGKNGKGTTPVRSLGPLDQHSQLQLYLDGPADKVLTILTERTEGFGPEIAPEIADVLGANYMSGRTIGDLVTAEAEATINSLKEKGRPVRTLSVETFDAASTSVLMVHFMIETIVLASILEIDPFDQPAVERGKTLAQEYLAAL